MNRILRDAQTKKEHAMKKAFLTIATLVASASSAAALGITDGFVDPVPSTSVPEISALEGTAALAALAAIVLLTWERRRRAA